MQTKVLRLNERQKLFFKARTVRGAQMTIPEMSTMTNIIVLMPTSSLPTDRPPPAPTLLSSNQRCSRNTVA